MRVLLPSRKSTGIFTVPLLSVLADISVPFGKTTTIGAFGIGFPCGSFSVVFMLVFPTLSPIGFVVIFGICATIFAVIV